MSAKRGIAGLRQATLASLALALLLALAGCQTRAGFEADLDQWLGVPEHELISAMGPPEHIYEMDGYRYLTWVTKGVYSSPGYPPSYRVTDIGQSTYYEPVGGFPSSYSTYFCRITYTVHEGKVTKWSWEGNDCYNGLW
jgi:hypothetical protein